MTAPSTWASQGEGNSGYSLRSLEPVSNRCRLHLLSAIPHRVSVEIFQEINNKHGGTLLARGLVINLVGEPTMSRRWLQIRGDPSIRQCLFSQSRVNNEFDVHLDKVIGSVEHLLTTRGIFHAKIHFSSGQVTLWSMSDPYNYQVYVKDEFLAPGFMKAFPRTNYPLNATVPPKRIREVLNIIRSLRLKDDSIYLRSGSLNIINGVVGLVFSCDGSHYIDYLDMIRHQEELYG